VATEGGVVTRPTPSWHRCRSGRWTRDRRAFVSRERPPEAAVVETQAMDGRGRSGGNDPTSAKRAVAATNPRSWMNGSSRGMSARWPFAHERVIVAHPSRRNAVRSCRCGKSGHGWPLWNGTAREAISRTEAGLRSHQGWWQKNGVGL